MRDWRYHLFAVSGLTLGSAAFVEWQVPGFVSRVFPLYWLLLITISAGLLALRTSGKPAGASWCGYAIGGVVGLGLCVLVLHSTVPFGPFRLALVLIALMLPMVLLRALKY